MDRASASYPHGAKGQGRERIIIPLDRQPGHLKFTQPGRHWLPYFVYTGCLCRRGCRWGRGRPLPLLHRLIYPGFPINSQCRRGSRCRRGLHRLPLLHQHPRGRQGSANIEVRLFPPVKGSNFLVFFHLFEKRRIEICSNLGLEWFDSRQLSARDDDLVFSSSSLHCGGKPRI